MNTYAQVSTGKTFQEYDVTCFLNICTTIVTAVLWGWRSNSTHSHSQRHISLHTICRFERRPFSSRSLIPTYGASWCKNCPTEEVISFRTVSSHLTFPQTGVINLTWDVMIFPLSSSVANIKKKLWVNRQLCDISVSLNWGKALK